MMEQKSKYIVAGITAVLVIIGIILASVFLFPECKINDDCLAKTCFTAQCTNNKCGYSPVTDCYGQSNSLAPEGAASPEVIEVIYDLPEDWVRGNSPGDALWDHELGPGIPFTKLSYDSYEIGGENEAKNKISTSYLLATGQGCDSWPCAHDSGAELKMTVINSVSVYFYSVPSSYYGEGSWQSNLSIVKDGVVYYFTLYGDSLDRYVTQLEVIVASIRLNL